VYTWWVSGASGWCSIISPTAARLSFSHVNAVGTFVIQFSVVRVRERAASHTCWWRCIRTRSKSSFAHEHSFV